ncbi:DUF6249 domain-containing protein [Mucilaginibacter rivuli]|uniref:DUF6249 domain-containing protein n=1 Tax=Mucilaginibacter rivuli TaxID=2857527 RepID=UPI0021029130|nr:DUF6249 domain-containing protein [Mucilaginibacter rivuli]
MDSHNLALLIPILVPISLFAMIFGIVHLHKKERMAMIERGMDPRAYKSQPAPFQYLKWAFLLMGAGLGLFLANILDHTLMANLNHTGDPDNPAIYFSLIAIFGGLGLYTSYRIEKKETIDKKDNRLEE